MENLPTEEEIFDATSSRKRGRKRTRKTAEVGKVDENFELKLIKPKTNSQQQVFDDYDFGNNLLLHGSAGTGKTFCAIYLALRTLFTKGTKQKKLVIVRSAVPTRDIGFMPGTANEKLAVYEAPYQAIFNELFGRADSYGAMKFKKQVQFVPTSFIRGTTIDNAIIVVDECSNLNGHELDSIITRVGENSRIIFCGDYSQSDFTREHERNGLKDFMRIIEKMKSFKATEFTEDDIVRSKMIKDYIVNKNRLGIVF